MDFYAIANKRQSCRDYVVDHPVEKEKLDAVLESARLAPSACNGQPYHLTVCEGEKAKEVAELCKGMGLNRFASQAPVMIVVSEVEYVTSAKFGARVKNNDYRSMDIGIVTAFITLEAAAQGLGTCIMGWFDDEKIREICHLSHPVRLVIALGYPGEKDVQREKKRKSMDELVTRI
ncbi:MAG: nitroreductase family protein [Clostridia bacterium]|nr:nitroreductase family protein [Clostridia bacterium]